MMLEVEEGKDKMSEGVTMKKFVGLTHLIKPVQ